MQAILFMALSMLMIGATFGLAIATLVLPAKVWMPVVLLVGVLSFGVVTNGIDLDPSHLEIARLR